MMSFIIFTLMGINIFLAFPLIILEIKKNKDVSFLIAIFLGILGYYFRPFNSMDLKRYYDLFADKEEIFIFLKYGKDLYAKNLIYFIYFFNISKYFLGFVSAFITYYFLVKSFFIEVRIKNIRKNRLLYFVLFMTSIPIVGYTGVRFYPALAVFVYGIQLYFINKKIYVAFLMMSVFMHFAILVPMSIFVVYRFFGKYFSILNLKKICFLAFILGIILNENLYLNIINGANFILGNHFFKEGYINGMYGKNYYQGMSLLGYVSNIIVLYAKKFIILIYVLSIKKDGRKEKYILLLIILVALLQNFRTPFERYFFIMYPLMIFSSFKEKILKKEKSKQFLYAIILFQNLFLMFIQMILFSSVYISSYQNILKLGWFSIIIENVMF